MKPINLLPPETAERSQRRRRRVGYIALGAAYLVLLVLISVWWQSKAQTSEDALSEQQAINQSLNTRIAQLTEGRDLRGRFEDGVARIESVLQTDVAWGRLLNDLGRVIPDRTWVATFTGAAEVDEELPGIFGSLQINGTGFDYPDVASWLRTLNSDRWPAVGAGWLSSSTRQMPFEGAELVDFATSAFLTEEALSDRAATRIPEVPE